jgi:hypothetical protein
MTEGYDCQLPKLKGTQVLPPFRNFGKGGFLLRKNEQVKKHKATRTCFT